MWIRHLPADYYKQQSGFDNLVFLWKTNNESTLKSGFV